MVTYRQTKKIKKKGRLKWLRFCYSNRQSKKGSSIFKVSVDDPQIRESHFGYWRYPSCLVCGKCSNYFFKVKMPDTYVWEAGLCTECGTRAGIIW